MPPNFFSSSLLSTKRIIGLPKLNLHTCHNPSFLRKFIHFTNLLCIICLVPAWWTKNCPYSYSSIKTLCKGILLCRLVQLSRKHALHPARVRIASYHLHFVIQSDRNIFGQAFKSSTKFYHFSSFYHFTFHLIFLLFNLFFSRSPIGQLFCHVRVLLVLGFFFLAITFDGMKLFFTPF